MSTRAAFETRSSPEVMDDAPRPIRRGMFAGSAWKRVPPLAVLILIWFCVFLSFAHLSRGPQASPFGVDFAHNMSSAYVMGHGGNPYNSNVLVRGEHIYLQTHGVANTVHPSDRAFIWGGYPPLFFWLLEPLTGFSFPVVAMAWILAMVGLMAGGFLACLYFLGWSTRMIPTILFLGMPQTTFQAYYANPASLVFAAIMAGLALHRRWPLSAGLLLSVTWLKPQMGIPGVLLIALFSRRGFSRVVGGFLLGTVALVGITLLGPGPQSLVSWLHGIVSVSGNVAVQPNMIPPRRALCWLGIPDGSRRT